MGHFDAPLNFGAPNPACYGPTEKSPWVFQREPTAEILTTKRVWALAIALFLAIAAIALVYGIPPSSLSHITPQALGGIVGGISGMIGAAVGYLMIRSLLDRRYHERDITKEMQNDASAFTVFEQDKCRPGLAASEEEYYRKMDEEVGHGYRCTFNANSYYVTEKLFYAGERTEERQKEDEALVDHQRKKDGGRDFIVIDGRRIISENTVLSRNDRTQKEVNSELDALAKSWGINPLRLKGLAVQTPMTQLMGNLLNARYRQRELGGCDLRQVGPLYFNYYRDSSSTPYQEAQLLMQIVNTSNETNGGRTPYFIPVRLRTNLITGEAEFSWRVVRSDEVDAQQNFRFTPSLSPLRNLTQSSLPESPPKKSPWVFEQIESPKILEGGRPKVLTDNKMCAIAAAVFIAIVATMIALAETYGGGAATTSLSFPCRPQDILGAISLMIGGVTIFLLLKSWLHRREYDRERTKYDGHVMTHVRDITKEMESFERARDTDLFAQDNSSPKLAASDEEYYRRLNEEVGQSFRFSFDANSYYLTKDLFYVGERTKERQKEDEAMIKKHRRSDGGRDIVMINGRRMISGEQSKGEKAQARMLAELEKLAKEWGVDPIRLKGMACQDMISQPYWVVLAKRYCPDDFRFFLEQGSTAFHNYYRDKERVPYHECLVTYNIKKNGDNEKEPTPYFLTLRVKTNLKTGALEVSWTVVRNDRPDLNTEDVHEDPILDPLQNLTKTLPINS